MGLDIWFREDVANRLTALHQANDRALALAERYGMDAEAAGLCRDVYAGCLGDVALAFGLVLTIPKRKEVARHGPMRGRLVANDRSLATAAGSAARGPSGSGRGPG